MLEVSEYKAQSGLDRGFSPRQKERDTLMVAVDQLGKRLLIRSLGELTKIWPPGPGREASPSYTTGVPGSVTS